MENLKGNSRITLIIPLKMTIKMNFGGLVENYVRMTYSLEVEMKSSTNDL